jgi:hypothetical protein
MEFTPMPRTPQDTAIALEKALAQLNALRASLAAIHLPSVMDRLDYSDDLLTTVGAMINRAANDLFEEQERIQSAEEVAYAREHGLSALDEMDEAA